MKIAQAPLENWLREYYFTNEIDISGSGVEDFSMAELRQLIGLKQEEFDQLIFHDSPSLGSPGLRKAIAQRWGDGDISRVMATNGSSEAIFLVMNALLKPGDEVIVLDPGYHSLVHIAESIGCQLKRWPLRFEQQFAPDFEELKSLITQNTRMIIVNFPHNPTGVSVSLEQQTELINLAAGVGAYLAWDAAFIELTYDKPSLPEVSLLYDKAISFGTLSKAYGLPGLRVGWCFAPPDVLEDCIHLRDYISLALSPLVELVAQRAIENGDCLLNIRQQQAYTNREILAEWVEINQDFVEWVKPQGGVTAFPRFRGISDIEAFCHHLINPYGVLLLPGTCFHHPNHVRLGFGGSTANLQVGLSRLSKLLSIYHSNTQLTHI
ncbi:capreomycidine synthase [Nostoc sp. WHI]|uniref:capreomycidine synthase n=1 Tax=Nostoc sp. WHI TaxID=2650611 RepID=UPI0018C4C114|nr:capreomycidine synthase [Nostoc sp. WHI]MBG1269914.1 capreomycidine synthase [Nostoc sp. WHI]